MTQPPRDPSESPPDPTPYEYEKTDPGRPHPVESLFRDPASGQPSRPTTRHYVPSLTPPENQPGDDSFAWLFRDESRATVGESPARQPVDQPTGRFPGPMAAPLEAPTTAVYAPVPPTATPLSEGSPPAPPPGAGPLQVGPAGVPARPRRTGLVVALIILCLLVAVASGVGIAMALGSSLTGVSKGGASTPSAGAPTPSQSTLPSPSPTPAGSATPSQSPSSGASPAPLLPASTNVDCQAPPSTDSGGQAVSYAPGNMTDGDPSTAWRCDGTGVGHVVTFVFGSDTTIHQVGLINGYAKTDPTDGAKRYGEYRRITGVTWTFSNGTSVKQVLADGNESLQTLTVPTVVASQVTLKVDTSTGPGSKSKTRDAILVSEVAFA